MDQGEENQQNQPLGQDEVPPQGYVHPHVIPAAYGYHIDPRWAAHYSQHGYHPAVYGYQYPLQQMEGVPLPPGIPGIGGSTDPLEAVLGPFPCARLRNLPYDATLEDILVLFQGLVVIDVVLVGHGEAFVVFANPMDFQMGLQRNRQTIGRRFIEISPSSRADYYEAIAAQYEQERGPQSTAMAAVGATLEEGIGDAEAVSGDMGSPMAAFWGGEAAQHSAALQLIQPPPPPNYVDPGLSHHSSAGIVMSGRGGGHPSMPGRGPGMPTPLQKRTGGGIQIGDHTGFLRMRGLPFSASKDDIVTFFAGYNPVPESVVLTYRNDGRATGEAYIGFASAEDSKRAMDLHRRSMGNRYIELFISNKEEQGRALARFGNR